MSAKTIAYECTGRPRTCYCGECEKCKNTLRKRRLRESGPLPARTLTERFLDKVLIGDDCWEWTGAKNGRGYGQISFNGRPWKAHRLAYILWNRPLPTFMHVCHTCDNRACVKPSHLYAGTAKDNSADAVSRGRTARGARNGLTGLRPEQAAFILAARQSGAPGHSLAGLFGISQASVCDIYKGRGWKYLERSDN